MQQLLRTGFKSLCSRHRGPKLKTGLKRTDQTLHKRPAFCYLTTSSVTSSVSGAPPLALHRRSKAGRIQEPSGSRNGCVRVPRSCSVAYIKISTSISMGIDIRTSISVCVCVCVCVHHCDRCAYLGAAVSVISVWCVCVCVQDCMYDARTDERARARTHTHTQGPGEKKRASTTVT